MDSLFYKKAIDYWSQIPATVEGVLGGFGFISETDILGSRYFLEAVLQDNKRTPPDRNYVLDCGAGIGRISKFLLLDYFQKVDLVEQNKLFLDEAKIFIDNDEKLGELFNIGLQDFKPTKKYDIIWCQWVLGHLRDDDLIDFFSLCRDSLNPNGLIIVKENVTSSNCIEKDENDSSVTRPLKHLLSIFRKSKLKRTKEWEQTDFPKGIYPVWMFALRPGREIEKIKKDLHLSNEIDLNKMDINK